MKSFILVVVTTIASLIFWMVTKPIFRQFSLGEVGTWLGPLAALVVFSGLMALAFLLLDSNWSWLPIIFNLVIFALLLNPKEIVIWAGVLIALLFQFLARQAVKVESRNRLKFSLPQTLHSGLGRFITSLLILISFAFFWQSGIREAAARQELPARVRQATEVIVGNYIGENSENQNPSLRARATEEILSQMTNFLKPYFVFLPPVLAFGLFLILQGLSFIFVWLALLLAILVFHLLKILKLVKIETEMKEAEVVRF